LFVVSCPSSVVIYLTTIIPSELSAVSFQRSAVSVLIAL
jgi:hypothetical protein